MSGTLYIVATPIGNLGDITLRAVETLKNVDFILCEDTRQTQKLLNHFEIKTKTISYHQHSKGGKVYMINSLLEANKNLALVTDAGTPGVADPGNKLINQLTSKQINIVPVPGPSAVIAALSVSGFPTDKFLFLGFPPHKGRANFFKKVAESEHTVAFYESSHRIKKCLDELNGILDRSAQLCVCRELTKKFETIYRGTIEEIIKKNIPEKGEFVVVVTGNR